MQKQNKAWKKILALVCVMLLLSFVCVAFLPHSHQCIDSDCTVCAFIETSCNLLIGVLLLGVVYQLACLEFVISNTKVYVISTREGTPVGLKVKLSD